MNSNNSIVNFAPLKKSIMSYRYILIRMGAGLFLGVLGSISIIYFTNPLYEASVFVKPATLGTLLYNVNTPIMKGVEVEPTSETIVRLKSNSFYTQDIIDVCVANKSNAGSADIISRLEVTALRGSSIISLKYRAPSTRQAKSCLEAIFDQLVSIHNDIAQPSITLLKNQYDITGKQLEEARKFNDYFQKKLVNFDAVNSKFSESMVMLSATISEREAIFKFETLHTQQGLLLTEPFTSPTKMLEPIYSQNSPVFPSRYKTVLVGLFLGLVIGLLSLFLPKLTAYAAKVIRFSIGK